MPFRGAGPGAWGLCSLPGSATHLLGDLGSLVTRGEQFTCCCLPWRGWEDGDAGPGSVQMALCHPGEGQRLCTAPCSLLGLNPSALGPMGLLPIYRSCSFLNAFFFFFFLNPELERQEKLVLGPPAAILACKCETWHRRRVGACGVARCWGPLGAAGILAPWVPVCAEGSRARRGRGV